MTLPLTAHLRLRNVEARINELRTPEYREDPDMFPDTQRLVFDLLGEWSRLNKLIGEAA